MPYCVFRDCKNSSQKQKSHDGISFHRFPVEPNLRKYWVSIVRENRKDKTWTASKFCVVCSAHFKKEDIYLRGEKEHRCLKKHAKPLLLVEGTEIQATYQEAVPVHERTTDEKIAFQETGLSPEKTTDNDNFDETIDSDLESISDKSRKHQMRNKLRRQKLVHVINKKKNLNLQQKVERLKKRNASLKNILKELYDKNFVNIDTYKTLSENIVATELFHNLNRTCTDKKKIKYSPAMRKFCLTLNFYSPRGYEYVRKVFNTCLPHPKTLAKWYTHVKSGPGFTEEAFTALKQMTDNSPHKLICALMFDEMALRQQKLWDGKQYVGVVDMGDEISESTILASQVFVFMLVGINQRFKIPLGYFLTNILTGEQKCNLVNLCLIKCYDAGVQVVSLTFDGHATNITAMQLLGCNIDKDINNMKTSFQHPSDGSEVACFLDPSHVIKLIKNQLEAKKQFLDKDGGVVDWNFVIQLNKLQEDEGLHLANKFSKKHIMFQNNIVKVKLATQTLSRSVGKAMQVCRKELSIPEFGHSEPTETFISLINDMFDVYNTQSMAHFDFKKAIHKGNKDKIYALLDQLKEYIQKLKIKTSIRTKVVENKRSKHVIVRFYKKIVEARCKTGFIGALINIESLKSLTERMIVKEKCLLFLPTYKLSQDHLEIFFGCVRMCGGYNDNPNVKQFKSIYGKLLTHLELRSLETGNCVPLENVAILTCSSAIQVINSTSLSYRHEELDNSELGFLSEIYADAELDTLAQTLDVPIMNEMRKMIVGYIAGSVVHYIKRVIKCEFCLSYLLATERQDFHKLIGLRNKGGLFFPSVDTYDVCAVAEMVVRKILKENVAMKSKKDYHYVRINILKYFIGNDNIFKDLENAHECHGADHKVNIIKVIVETFLSIRFHHYIKIRNYRQKCKSRSQKTVFKRIVQNKGV